MGGDSGAAYARAMFGTYDIIETIGQGGMGVVYRAHDTSLDRIVALKVLREDLRTEGHLVARFQREAEAFATLNHPNIVHIYSVGSVAGIPYIAMEYIDGLPLSEIMKRERRINWKRALELTGQVSSALACAHDAQIIHRDIKPANIIVDGEGKAYVTDFGIAKILTAETQLTIEGARLGTPEYMSPERCQNHEITAASDIYSTGILLFQMLSGRLPYEAPTPITLIRKILVDPPTRLREFVAEVPENVEKLVAHMIEKKAKNRPADCHELTNIINRVRLGKSIVDESGHAGALASMRTGSSARSGKGRRSGERAVFPLGAFRAVWTGWRRLSGWVRMLVVCAFVVTAGAVAGAVVAERMAQDVALVPVGLAYPSVSLWDSSGSVSMTLDDASGIQLSSISLPDFALGGLAWLPSGNKIVLEVDGVAGTPRQGQRAVCLYDLDTHTASISLPPFGRPMQNPQTSPLGLLGPMAGGPWGDWLDNAFIYRKFGYDWPAGKPYEALEIAGVDEFPGESLLRVLQLGPLGLRPERSVAFPHRIGVAASSPDGVTLALSILEAKQEWVLVERKVKSNALDPTVTALTRGGRPFVSVEYSADGKRIAYLRESEGETRELGVVEGGGKDLDGVILARGRLTVSARGFSADGEGYAVVERGKGGGGRGLLFSVAEGEAMADLGACTLLVWHPSGRLLLAVAQDHRGNSQLWGIDVEAPHERTQITFFAGGIRNQCYLSPDGSTALTTLAGDRLPTLAVINLEEAGVV